RPGGPRSTIGQSRPDPDRQAVARGRQELREALQCRLVGRTQLAGRRQATLSREYGGRCESDLCEHDRRRRTVRHLDRSGLQSRRARALLRQGDRNPDTALGNLPVGEDRHPAQGRHARMAAGTRLDIARMVPAMRLPTILALGSALALAACSERAPAPQPADARPELANAHPAPAPADDDRVLLWGDTHIHSINSIDAFSTGMANADAESAYRFARGMPVIFPRTGQRVQIDRPLDFMVLADHAVSLGVSSRIAAGDPEILKYPIAQKLLTILREQGGRALTAATMFGGGLSEEERAQYEAEMQSPEV